MAVLSLTIHEQNRKGIGCFSVNTKIGTGVALESQPDVEELPIAVPHGNFKPVALSDSQKHPTFIMFDLETTNLIRGTMMPHITQIAAVEPQSKAQFNTYVKPKVPISAEAQRITGIVVSDSGNMTLHGEPVENSSVTSALNSCITWLSRFQNVILVAHNGRRFDFPVLISTLERIGTVRNFCDAVIGCIDSLGVFRKVFPKESTYKQEDLVKKFLHTSYSAHDAIEDFIALGHLLFHANFTPTVLLKHSFPPMAVYNQRLFNKAKTKNVDSLSALVAAGVMKRSTAEIVAGSGLNLNHLRLIS